ncbi:MAG TPA: hypothetical protein VF207_05195 [Chthoniobacterales bacterium]|jgi:hypothetical protein
MTSRIFAAFLAIILIGCRSVNELSGLGPEAKTRIGQLRYATGGRSVVGDIVLRNLTAGDYDLSFSKGGVTVLELQTRGPNMTATGLLAKSGWSGAADRAPGPLKPWAMLKEALVYFDSDAPSAQKPGRWSATFQRRNGTLVRADIQFAQNRSMAFSFAQ